MNEIRKKLEALKNNICKDTKKFEDLETELPEEDHRLLGPTNDIEYQRMKKELRRR